MHIAADKNQQQVLNIQVNASADVEEVHLPATHEKLEHTQEIDCNAQSAMKKLQLACVCSFIFMCLQFAGGYYARSLAIMTDAAHLFSDVAGFLVSLFALYLGQLPPSAELPFGYHRAEVIGALLSVLLIWVLAVGLMFTAVRRLIDQGRPDAEQTVDGRAMFVVAVFGLGINFLLMMILGHGHHHGHGHSHSHNHSHGHSDSANKHAAAHSPSPLDSVQAPMSAMALIDSVEESTSVSEGLAPATSVFENINVRAAYIHALGDFLQSLGVCLAGGVIWYNPAWQMADPITTILFSCLVLGTTLDILTKSIHIMMEGAPPALDLRLVEKRIRALAAVYDVHDLHIWMLTEGHYAASVHILPHGEPRTALRATQQLLTSLGVRRLTVQVEDSTEKDWNEDLYCNWASFSNVALEAESPMSVPRARTKKAAYTALPVGWTD